MKQNRNLAVIILVASLAVLLILYFIATRQRGKQYQWTESYQVSSAQPYGTLFIQKLLANQTPGMKFTLNDKQPLHRLLDSTSLKEKTGYVFIGQEIHLDGADAKALLNFIYAGNEAFIASVHLPFNIIDSMFTSECDKPIFLVQNNAPSVTLNFYNTHLKTEKGYTYSYRYGNKDFPYFWNTLNPEVFCDSTTTITPLGYSDSGKVNFFKLVYGKGTLYVHSNPLVFTNYFLTSVDKADYASSVFSHLNDDSMIWDEFSKSPITQNNAPTVNPIAYILQQDALRYAWWLLVGSAVLYTVFAAKRKQRVIPVREANVNSSLEFVTMIAALHFENGDHQNIARKKMKYFYYFIRAKYNIHTQSLSEAHLKRLSEKAKITTDDVEPIAREFNYLERQPYYNVGRLVDLHNALENFYTKCK